MSPVWEKRIGTANVFGVKAVGIGKDDAGFYSVCLCPTCGHEFSTKNFGCVRGCQECYAVRNRQHAEAAWKVRARKAEARARAKVGTTNKYGVRCASYFRNDTDRIMYKCVCGCGAEYTVMHMTTTRGCPDCREEAKRACGERWTGYDDLEPTPLEDRCADLLDPKKMWERICARHRAGKTCIDDIATRRKD